MNEYIEYYYEMSQLMWTMKEREWSGRREGTFDLWLAKSIDLVITYRFIIYISYVYVFILYHSLYRTMNVTSTTTILHLYNAFTWDLYLEPMFPNLCTNYVNEYFTRQGIFTHTLFKWIHSIFFIDHSMFTMFTMHSCRCLLCVCVRVFELIFPFQSIRTKVAWNYALQA